MNLTFKTRFCERMFHDVPWVGCRCIDCRTLRLKRRIRRKVQSACGALIGHRWRDEKEFASCARCHRTVLKRELPTGAVVHRS